MARVLMFEDDSNTLLLAGFAIEDSGHELVGVAGTLEKAQEFLAKLIRKDLVADVLLLDGNLDNKYPQKEFRFTPRDQEATANSGNPIHLSQSDSGDLIIKPENSKSMGADARMIKKIIDVSGLLLPVIGISSDSMKSNGINVDYDLGKIAFENFLTGIPGTATEELNKAIHHVLKLDLQ